MWNQIASLVMGTSGLIATALVAMWLTWARTPVSAALGNRVRTISALTVLVQVLHFAEEYQSRFYEHFPDALGIPAWPVSFFVLFNLIWLGIWLLAIALLPRFRKAAAFPLWFLAIASAANAVIHPLLAVATHDYFPGLWTSPLSGMCGALLLVALTRATRDEENHGRGGPGL